MIDKRALGLSGGVLWGVGLFLLTLFSMATGYAGVFLAVISEIYPGYSISFIGSVIGLIYGFVDAFIGLYIFGWLYGVFKSNTKNT